MPIDAAEAPDDTVNCGDKITPADESDRLAANDPSPLAVADAAD